MKTSMTFSIDTDIALQFKKTTKTHLINKSQLVERLLENWAAVYNKLENNDTTMTLGELVEAAIHDGMVVLNSIENSRAMLTEKLITRPTGSE